MSTIALCFDSMKIQRPDSSGDGRSHTFKSDAEPL